MGVTRETIHLPLGCLQGGLPWRGAGFGASVSGQNCRAALEATQGQMDGFFSQLPYTCYIEEVASVGD